MTDRTTILARLARLAAANASHENLAARLCEASRLILGAQGAWITVLDGTSSRLPLSATDQVAADLEDIQDVIGQGPSISAYHGNSAVTMTLHSDPDDRWPEFSRTAWHRITTVLRIDAYPMRPASDTFGVLNTYFTTAEPLESGDAAQFLADAVGAALLRDPVPIDDSGFDRGMWSARSRLHQATGMVIAQLHMPPEDALAILRAHAYAHDATLADIAEQVVNRRLDFRGDS